MHFIATIPPSFNDYAFHTSENVPSPNLQTNLYSNKIKNLM